jgi:hypothetical protein
LTRGIATALDRAAPRDGVVLIQEANDLILHIHNAQEEDIYDYAASR